MADVLRYLWPWARSELEEFSGAIACFDSIGERSGCHAQRRAEMLGISCLHLGGASALVRFKKLKTRRQCFLSIDFHLDFDGFSLGDSTFIRRRTKNGDLCFREPVYFRGRQKKTQTTSSEALSLNTYHNSQNESSTGQGAGLRAKAFPW